MPPPGRFTISLGISGKTYLNDIKRLSEAEIKCITNDPARLKPGPMQFPDGVLTTNKWLASGEASVDDEIEDSMFRNSYPAGYDALLRRYHAELPELFRKRPYDLLKDREFPSTIKWEVEKSRLTASDPLLMRHGTLV